MLFPRTVSCIPCLIFLAVSRILAGPVPQLQLELGVQLTWPGELGHTYQPQTRTDASAAWVNQGPLHTGEGQPLSAYVPGRPTTRDYSLLETYPVLVAPPPLLLNPDFETGTGSTAANWLTLASQPPTRITTDAKSGTHSIRCFLQNIGSSPAEGILEQTVNPAGSALTPGAAYTLSFWKKPVSSGPSYIQQYWLQWLNASGGIIGGTGLQNFGGALGTWSQTTVTGLVAPAGTTGVKVVFRFVTGAVSGGHGEVLIDDVLIVPDGSGSLVPSTATRRIAVEPALAGRIAWHGATGVRYEPELSSDLSAWTRHGPALFGQDAPLSTVIPMSGPATFARLVMPEVVVEPPSNARIVTTHEADAIGVAWDASPTAGVTGYRLLYGPIGGPLTAVVEVGNVSGAIIPALDRAVTYEIVVLALVGGNLSATATAPLTAQPEAGLGLDPLHNATTALEPEIRLETATALVTRIADRVRARHAREAEFQRYDLYLPFYWEQRILRMEITDRVAKGGSELVFNYTTLAPLSAAEFRAFLLGRSTVAEYHFNTIAPLVGSGPSTDYPGETEYHYAVTLTHQLPENRPLRLGDRVELELSQFFAAVRNGQLNYYGTTLLYVVGEGIVPWYEEKEYTAGGSRDSRRLPEHAWLGGLATLPYHYSNEPTHRFKQMAGNIAPASGVPFLLGRRIHHTNFQTGAHSENGNPLFTTHAGKAGPKFISGSCIDCHVNNGRSLPPAVGQALTRAVVKVGAAPDGAPHPILGETLQPQNLSGAPEAGVTLASYTEIPGTYGDGTPYSLRRPAYAFTGVTPAFFSVRSAPPLVGLGLLEAVPEAAVLALADPSDADGDGISGRPALIEDPTDHTKLRLGRFTYKGSQATVAHQIAYALNRDMGVTTSLFPVLDGDTAPQNPPELDDTSLNHLDRYVSLLGVAARRDLLDTVALRGEQVFTDFGCVACHVPTLQTGPHHPLAELRNQTIRPYTDLLLHDLGPGLADNLADEGASGAEWRTAPLWNIGLTAGVAGGEAYLHDGRARTLEEAILWHGGEGETAKEAFRTAPAADRAALVKFLRSL